jgi:hypothetical protein
VLLDELCDSQEALPHVLSQAGELALHSAIQDLHAPSHSISQKKDITTRMI